MIAAAAQMSPPLAAAAAAAEMPPPSAAAQMPPPPAAAASASAEMPPPLPAAASAEMTPPSAAAAAAAQMPPPLPAAASAEMTPPAAAQMPPPTPVAHQPASPVLRPPGPPPTSSPVAQHSMYASESPLDSEYIRIQRRLLRSTERFHRRSLELQRDMASSLRATAAHQSQMVRWLVDMQLLVDNRFREQNQLLGVLVEHFTHQQDASSSVSSANSTRAETPASAVTRRTSFSTTGTSVPSSKKPRKK
ncbi:uncharacterized protein LOC128648541 isoform X1 [Bombina bombina]|uniref:uncharacterized protein LOC128648541 isoform X1 n=1 Tax=Bombina bombina TaxID=8345 RepID=UPI00235AD088|nr:uncharacterized protein LOC128648541 isoform X1 [Bombina bombina]